MKSIYAAVLYLCCASVACLGQTAAPPQEPQNCLHYLDPTYHLSGTLIKKIYPGPPEYESVRKGDQPELFWLLVLPYPICVVGNAADGEATETGVRRMQLIVNSEEVYDTHQSMLGKQVVITGTLFPGSTVHHRTPVLIIVESIKRERHRKSRRSRRPLNAALRDILPRVVQSFAYTI